MAKKTQPVEEPTPPVKKRSKLEYYIKSYWRPMMAWQYLLVCLFDFLIAPIIYAKFNFLHPTTVYTWHPLTVENGSFYHVAMGAIIGVAAWSRGQEKIESMKNGFYGVPPSDPPVDPPPGT